jgi:hypothetical protein
MGGLRGLKKFKRVLRVTTAVRQRNEWLKQDAE